MDDLYNNLKVYEPEVKGMSSSNSSTQNMAFVSSSNNNSSSSNEAVNAAHGVTIASTQVNTAYSTNIDNLSDAVIYKFENASKSLDKLIECQIVDNCKKGLGYENYNAIPPPYTGNFMPPTLDLSFTGLDEFVNKPIVENSKAKSDEELPKEVRKCNDAPSIED
ncbi:hypothetical protein Tco_0413325 [Tanacetum coccineum]